MLNLKLYNHRLSILFHKYLHGNSSLQDLIKGLEEIETQIKKEKPEVSLWFKFSADDTLATTIQELKTDLSNLNNRDFTLERLREAINLQNELFIYYS